MTAAEPTSSKTIEAGSGTALLALPPPLFSNVAPKLSFQIW
jgi:hypothetical protein